MRRTICWPVFASLLPLHAHADLPTGGRVVAGQAAIASAAGNTLQVQQASQRAAIRWDSFSIAQGRSVVFSQPGAGAATLNIVTGNAASQLAGSLRADGSVLLINPNGVTITPTGRVDTGAGFIASTLAVSESDFMDGRLLFSGQGGAVRNQGLITTGAGGAVALLGSTAANEGVIRAPLGKVALGSASKATLDLSGDGFLQVLLPADAAGSDGQPLVSNSGLIQADGGTVMLKAATVREALREAVNMPGEVRARSVSGQDGAIVFDGGAGGQVTVSGRVDASADAGATRGGRIDVTGQAVALRGAELLASGPQQGGTVRIGGAFQGGRAGADATALGQRFTAADAPALANADTTTIDAGSRIDVSATGAQGVGGTAIVWSQQSTTLQGSVAATGAQAGGAVEVSSKSQIRAVDLGRVEVGAGGALLLDPKNLVVGTGTDADTSYVDPTALVNQLSAGVGVSLLASNDLAWDGAFAFVTQGNAGDLSLAAGRSVRLSGAFTTGLGNWSIVANAGAAAGVDPALRDTGAGGIDLSAASFINSNGRLSLTLADGAGNGGGLADGSNGFADRIRMGSFTGDGFSAVVAPGAATEWGAPPVIQFFGDVAVANELKLTGNLQSAQGSLTLSGASVNWTNEKTGGTITGESGTVRFVENGVTTRFGKLGGMDAARLELGSDATPTRVYGDADPGQAALGADALHVAAHNTAAVMDGLGNILADGSLAVSGPGVTAGVGSYSLQVGASGAIAFQPVSFDPGTGTMSGATGSYFIDLTPGRVDLTVTPRALTANVLNPSYVYGSPTAAATLSGIANNDALSLNASLNGSAVTLAGAAGSYAFANNLRVGVHGYTLLGLSGAASSNYTLDLSGVPSGVVSISPKPITYAGSSTSQAYGSDVLPSPELVGVLPGDDVGAGTQAITVVSSGTAGGSGTRPVGAYQVGLASLGGADSGNYVLDTAGNVPMQVSITPKTLSWQVAGPIASTYGTAATGMAATLGGVVDGDVIAPVFFASGNAIGARLAAGSYQLTVGGLDGTGAGNYQLAGSGQASSLFVARKPLTYGGADVTQVYGQVDAAGVELQGVESGDRVTAVSGMASSSVYAGQGESSALALGDYYTYAASLTGAEAGNYTIAASGNSLRRTTVTAKTLNFQLAGGSANTTYGTAATLPSVSLVGVVSGDLIGGTLALYRGAIASAVAANTPAGSYTWGLEALTGAGAGNYTLATSGNTLASLVIAPKPITWLVAAGSATYGDALSNTTLFDGVLAGDSVLPVLSARGGDGNVVARPVVGTSYLAGVTSLDGAAAGNYVLQGAGNTEGALTITPRTVGYSIAAANATYGTLATPGAVTWSNLVAGDSLAPTIAFSSGGVDLVLDARTHTGSYLQRVTGIHDANYVLASSGNVDSLLTIAPKPLSFSTPDVQSVYGTSAVLGASTLSGVLAGDDVTAGPTLFNGIAVPYARLDAGTYANTLEVRTLGGADASNYVITGAGSTWGTLSVAPKALNYSLALYYNSLLLGGTTTYGNLSRNVLFESSLAGQGAVATLGGVLPEDLGQVAMNSSTLGLPSLATSSSGNYSVGTYTWTGGTLSGAKSGNYTVAATGNSDFTLQIAPRPLSVVMDMRNGGGVVRAATYGTTAGYAPSVTLPGLMSGDNVSTGAVLVTAGGNLTLLPERLAAGSYAMAMAGPLTGADTANYTAVPIDNGFTVQPRQLTYNIANSSSTYGQLGTPGGMTLSGVLTGDDVSGNVNVTRGSANVVLAANSAAGTYLLQSAGLAGAQAGNYTLAFGNDGTHTINTAPLTLVYDPATLSFTYGSTWALPSLAGALFGDDVSYSATATPTPVTAYSWLPTAVRDLMALPLLDAQRYRMDATLAGAGSSNYHITNPTATINVAPKPLTSNVQDRTTVYGDYLGVLAPELSGVLPGDDVQTRWEGFTAYTPQTAAGVYSQTLLLASTGKFYNYVLPPTTALLTINKRPLAYTPNASASITYGDNFSVGSLDGVLFGDDVTANVGFSSATLPDMQVYLGNMTYGPRANAGTHAYTLQVAGLAGAASGNYVMAPMTYNGSVVVAPRVLTWSVADTSFTYGGLRNCDPGQGCNAWEAITPAYGNVTLQGKLDLDDVWASLLLIDQVGRTGTISAALPAGPYYQVVSGLTGSKAANYVVAATGNTPGVLTVKPQWIWYDVTSGSFMPGIGMIGDPGRVTGLYGRNPGDSANGMIRADITPFVVARDANGKALEDLSNLSVGRYTLRVEGITGADAGNYRIAQPEYGFRDGGSMPGVFDVFPDATLGLGLTSLAAPPAPAPLAPVVEAPGQYTYFRPSTGLGTEFGRYDNVSGTDTDVTIGDRGGSVSGRAQGVVEGSVSLGDADLSAQAGSAAEALLKFGVTGISASASAGVHADVRVDQGPGYVMVGVQADAEAELSANRTGVTVAGQARAGATAEGGADGDIGIGDGSVSANTSVFAYARTDNEWTFKDGKLVSKFDEAVGVGASAGTNLGLASSAGSVDAGIIVYSPGSLGGKLDFSGGYSGGTLSLGLDIGAQIGLFGAGVSLNIDIDFDSITQAMGDNSTVSAITNFFGFSIAGRSQPDDMMTAVFRGASQGTPEDRIRYLRQNPSWENYTGTYGTDAYAANDSNRRFIGMVDLLESQAKDLLQRELNYQKTFLDLMKTDQRAAAEYLRSDSVAAMKTEEQRLQAAFANMGLQMAMQDGKIVAVNL
ncbi:filamentous hemagglutinin N-terminal domain-containing protein [Ramlibacter sp. G-1-2-2]|uniref:Filamentous hemagglutinin N-terminal domain-containing protein n=1 Tax=Ramlibacter agri TaxID=2728837 RepID=A0A848H0A5_9BURK|nr:filamentous hemagglutinin N-terminal domain-containing protein [Ramlibacter agri]NML44245.1 filamentous hemagglutinin N-terminal domain-containing protein [Ramlibacter agri]